MLSDIGEAFLDASELYLDCYMKVFYAPTLASPFQILEWCINETKPSYLLRVKAIISYLYARAELMVNDLLDRYGSVQQNATAVKYALERDEEVSQVHLVLYSLYNISEDSSLKKRYTSLELSCTPFGTTYMLLQSLV